MASVLKGYERWESVKWVCVPFILSFVAGGLIRAATRGRLDEANRAAMYILCAVVLVLMILPVAVGIRRWKRGQLTRFEKLFAVSSLALFPILIVAGWFADIFS